MHTPEKITILHQQPHDNKTPKLHFFVTLISYNSIRNDFNNIAIDRNKSPDILYPSCTIYLTTDSTEIINSLQRTLYARL